MKKRRLLNKTPVWYKRKIVYNGDIIEYKVAKHLDEKEFSFQEFLEISIKLRSDIPDQEYI